MNVQVLLFAAAKDLAGTPSAHLVLPDTATVGDLRRELVTVHPPLQRLAASLLVSVNNHYAPDSHTVAPNDEIACFPPVSGG